MGCEKERRPVAGAGCRAVIFFCFGKELKFVYSLLEMACWALRALRCHLWFCRRLPRPLSRSPYFCPCVAQRLADPWLALAAAQGCKLVTDSALKTLRGVWWLEEGRGRDREHGVPRQSWEWVLIHVGKALMCKLLYDRTTEESIHGHGLWSHWHF